MEKGHGFKVYTSYYAKIERDTHGLVPVRISTGVPAWFSHEYEEIPELYPGWDLVKGIKSGELSRADYERIYKEHLIELDVREMWEKLMRISESWHGRDLVLLCYEAPTDFCHRHLVAGWLGIEELGGKVKKV